MVATTTFAEGVAVFDEDSNICDGEHFYSRACECDHEATVLSL